MSRGTERKRRKIKFKDSYFSSVCIYVNQTFNHYLVYSVMCGDDKAQIPGGKTRAEVKRSEQTRSLTNALHNLQPPPHAKKRQINHSSPPNRHPPLPSVFNYFSAADSGGLSTPYSSSSSFSSFISLSLLIVRPHLILMVPYSPNFHNFIFAPGLQWSSLNRSSIDVREKKYS